MGGKTLVGVRGKDGFQKGETEDSPEMNVEGCKSGTGEDKVDRPYSWKQRQQDVVRGYVL